MNLVLLGPQGSGKGTQSEIISKKLKIPHINMGDLLRKTKGKLKTEINSYILHGNLVPDELMWKLLKSRLSKSDCKNGWILDNFPRNINQARMLDEFTKIDKMVEIFIPDNEVLKRASERGRPDDNKKAIRRRLEIYHKDSEILRRHYKILQIDGRQELTKITSEILEFLKR